MKLVKSTQRANTLHTVQGIGMNAIWLSMVNLPAFDGVEKPIFSADGQRMAYTARKGKKWIVVVNGQPSAEYDLGIENLVFSTDGQRIGTRWKG